jgi:pimeloyl-ACP methyl ester carboxylesterase
MSASSTGIMPAHEQFCDVGRGITLCYETFGDPRNPPLLLVMGLATQMVAWNAEFCELLASQGFYVIRFDNRDVGRSTHMRSNKPPSVWQLLTRSPSAASYTLADMADDAVGLLRKLGLAPAHIVGASMGGMIAQTIAVYHPEAVRSMTSIMSNTGSRIAGQPSPLMYPLLLRRPAVDRDGYLKHISYILNKIGSPGRVAQ